MNMTKLEQRKLEIAEELTTLRAEHKAHMEKAEAEFQEKLARVNKEADRLATAFHEKFPGETEVAEIVIEKDEVMIQFEEQMSRIFLAMKGIENPFALLHEGIYENLSVSAAFLAFKRGIEIGEKKKTKRK